MRSSGDVGAQAKETAVQRDETVEIDEREVGEGRSKFGVRRNRREVRTAHG